MNGENKSCVGCKDISSKECGVVEPIKYNGSIGYTKNKDRRCMGKIGKGEI